MQVYSRLTEAQLRNRLEPDKGIFIAESPKVIGVALEAGCEPLSLLTEEGHLETLAADIVDRIGEVPVYTGPRELLAQLTGYELTRGVLCAMRRPQLPTLEEICREARRVVVMDNVVNSTNTGAIFRAAAALGIDGALLTPTCCDPLNRRSVRVSMGTVFQLPWTYLPATQEEAFERQPRSQDGAQGGTPRGRQDHTLSASRVQLLEVRADADIARRREEGRHFGQGRGRCANRGAAKNGRGKGKAFAPD